MQLRPYQLFGALWLAQSERAMLGDPPGLGKTPQVIRACGLVGAVDVVIICPAVAVPNWEREWARWSARNAARPQIYSYDKVTRDRALRRELASRRIDTLVLDEAHYLKTVDSARTECIYSPKKPQLGLSASATYCWALSGTFSPNHVGEYWTHLRTLFPHLLETASKECLGYIGFLRHFTNWRAGEFGVQVLGVRKERRAELAAILREAGLRREISDVLPDLPSISWGTLAVPASEASAELRELEQDVAVQTLREHLEVTGDFLPASIHLTTLRRLIGTAKARFVARVIKDELTEGQYQKVVIWAVHTDVIDALDSELSWLSPLILDGRTPQKKRGAIVNEFQQATGTAVIIGQIQAAGTAITLTAAHHVVFVETTWVPDDNEQAAKRCHRFGQQQPVFVRISVLGDSIDGLVADTIQRKLANKLQIGDK